MENQGGKPIEIKGWGVKFYWAKWKTNRKLRQLLA